MFGDRTAVLVEGEILLIGCPPCEGQLNGLVR